MLALKSASKIFILAAGSFVLASEALAGDCELTRFSSVRPGQTHEAEWKFKKGTVCDMVWRPGVGTFYADIEIFNAPKSCAFKSNRYAIAANCSQKGKFKFTYKLFLDFKGDKGPVTFNVTLDVVD